ncbi:MAG: hypothetical protein ACRCTQ_02635 [Brevinemataceae bacterium]
MQDYLAVLFLLSAALWTEPPKILFPENNKTITSYTLNLFVEATPFDAENKLRVQYQIFERISGKIITNGIISEQENFSTSFNTKSWKNGEYLMKVIFVDKHTNSVSQASWRNFAIKQQS